MLKKLGKLPIFWHLQIFSDGDTDTRLLVYTSSFDRHIRSQGFSYLRWYNSLRRCPPTNKRKALQTRLTDCAFQTE